MKSALQYKIPLLALFILISAAAPAGAYGSSVEDLVGSFSIGKTIKIGSSSECFTAPQEADPLIPPQSSAAGGSLADSQPPSLAGFTIWPQEVNVSSPRPVNLTAHIIDDQEVWAAEAAFSGPDGQTASALFTPESRTSGTVRDGIFEAQMILPSPLADGNESLNATGYWHLLNMTLVDGEGNRRVLTEADLRGQGLTTVINSG